MLNNNHIGYLHFWCQKVLPLVYDNSLSYMEVLFKVKEKLNEVIKFTNQIPEYIDKKFIEEFSEEHLKELISEVFRTIEDAISANNEGTNTHFSTDYPNTGTLVWHDNKLYKTLHPIDAGDTVLPNSNIELVNFGDMFNEFLIEVKTRFTDNDDGLRETSSTDRPVHDLVWLNDELYEVIKPISEGNAYIYTGTNKNVEPINLDKIYDYILDLIRSIHEDLVQENADRENADIQLQNNIDAEATARENADTTLQDNIDAEATDRENADITLQGNIDAEALVRQNEDVVLNNRIDAIELSSGHYHTFEEFGAKGDGITDDTDAINRGLNSGYNSFILLADKTYIVNGDIFLKSNLTITGEENSCIFLKNGTMSEVFVGYNLDNIELSNFKIDGNCYNNIDYGTPDAQGNMPKHWGGTAHALINLTSCRFVDIHDMHIVNSWTSGIWVSDCPYCKIRDSFFENNRIVSIAVRDNTSLSTYESGKTLVTNNNIRAFGVLGIECLFGIKDVGISNNYIECTGDSYKFPSYAFDGTYPNVYPKAANFNRPTSPAYINPAQEGDGACIELTGKYTDVTSDYNNSVSISSNVCVDGVVGVRCEEMTTLVNVTGNSIRSCQEGIFIYSSNNITCNSNTITRCTNGIRTDTMFDPSYNVIIDGNVVEWCTQTGLLLNANNIIVSDNMIIDNPTGIYSTTGLNNALITGNTFSEIRAGSTLKALDLANWNVALIRVTNNNFNIPVPVGGTGLDNTSIKMFDNNIRFVTKLFGSASLTANIPTTIQTGFPIAPQAGQLQITPLDNFANINVNSISATDFVVTSDVNCSFNWLIDLNSNI